MGSGSGTFQCDTRVPSLFNCIKILPRVNRGLGGVVVEFSHPTSEAAGSILGPGASCWKVGSYLPMPGALVSSSCKLPVAI